MNFLFRSIQFGLMHVWPALVLVFCAATLPTSELGIAAILLSVATLFRPLVGLSLGRTAIRSAGEAYADNGRGQAQRVINLATRLGLLVSLLGFAAAAMVMLLVQHIYGLQMSAATIGFGTLFIYAFGITELLDGLLRAQGKFRELAMAVVASRIFGVIMFAILLPSFQSLDILFLLLLLAELCCVLLLGRHFLFAFRERAPLPLLSAESVRLLRYCWPVVINALSVYLYARAMVMVAGLHDSAASLGGFEMAVQITNLPMAVTIVCASVMSPVVARLFAEGGLGREQINAVVSYAASFSVWVNMCAAAYLMLIGPFVLLWLFPDVPSAPIVLAIVAPLVALKAYAQILSGELAIATGTAGIAARITITFAAVTVALGFVLSLMDGVRGAAVAMLLSHTLAVITTVCILGPKMGVAPRYRTGSSLLFSLACSAPSGLLVFWLRDDVAAASIAGTASFIAMAVLVLIASYKFRLNLHQPLLDGWRMVKSKGMGQNEEFVDLAGSNPDMLRDGAGLRSGLIDLIKTRSPAGYAFWLEGHGDAGAIPLQDHADIVYSIYLLGEGQRLSSAAAAAFIAHAASLPLFGKISGGVNAHLTAYTLGTVRLLEALGKNGDTTALYVGWRRELLLDRRDLPRWPRAWSHHIWRVSHWIGGVPSILLHLADSGKVIWATHSLVDDVLSSCESRVLDPHTGLLRPYRSELIQGAFRKLYRLRHDPDIADLGGVVHLLWVYHARGRSYVGENALSISASVQLERSPFMEEMPYCLDFDILQLKRTISGVHEPGATERGKRFMLDSLAFFRSPISSRYSLHKLPGALASMHEAAHLAGSETVVGLDIPPVDIIRTAYWL